MNRRARWLSMLVGALASSCASAPPPDGGTGATPPASGQPVTAAPTPPGAPAASDKPTAKITEIAGSAEATAYMKVTAVFTNPTSRPCRIPRYTLAWPGGTKEIPLDDFTIPPGESRQRSVRVHPEDGDLKKLTAESARIELGAC